MWGRKALKLQLALLVSLKPFSLLGTGTSENGSLLLGGLRISFPQWHFLQIFWRPFLCAFTLGDKTGDVFQYSQRLHSTESSFAKFGWFNLCNLCILPFPHSSCPCLSYLHLLPGLFNSCLAGFSDFSHLLVLRCPLCPSYLRDFLKCISHLGLMLLKNL